MPSMNMNLVTISEATTLMQAEIFQSFIMNKIPGNLMLSGSPGVGKSAIVIQLRTWLEEELTKHFGRPITVKLIDLRLAAEEASTVTGVPYVWEAEVRYGTPQWFPVAKPDTYYILFLDEITNTQKSTQHAAYRLVHERTIQNGKKLPNTCAIIGAGNLKSDKTGAVSLLPAFANRFAMHLEIDRTRLRDSWIEWAMNSGFDMRIIGQILYNANALFDMETPDGAWASPRSWEFVDRHLKNPMIQQSSHLASIAIAGAIGTARAVEFNAFCEHFGRLPDWVRIKNKDETYKFALPRDDDGFVFAVVIASAFQILESLQEDNTSNVDALVGFVSQFSNEMKIVMFKAMKTSKDQMRKMVYHQSLMGEFEKIKTFIK